MNTQVLPPHNGLLLLPCIQLPAKWDALRQCYDEVLRNAMLAVRSNTSTLDKAGESARLDILLLFDGGSNADRSQLFPAFQSLIADLYTIVCANAGQKGIELDFPGGVDIRLFAADTAPDATRVAACSGPLTSVTAFLESRLNYDRYLCPSSENWYNSITDRLSKHGKGSMLSAHRLERITSAASEDIKLFSDTTLRVVSSSSAAKVHTKVAVGGTFDHLHIGHKLLLTATIFVAQPGIEDREITIGITGDELLVNKKYAEVLESWDERQKRTAGFVESILVFNNAVLESRQTLRIDDPGPNGTAVKVTYNPQSNESGKITINYVRISDPFGPTITDETISALVISAETRAGGKAVNDKRSEKGWAPLEVFEVDVLDAGSVDATQVQDASAVKTSFESKISSTEIRRRLTRR